MYFFVATTSHQPLSAQANVITFSPQLPESKLSAMSRIKMGNVIKVV